MSRLKAIIILLFVSCQMFAVVWHNVNIDSETAGVMTTTYETEQAMESFTNRHLEKIIDHYRSATVATAGILISKKKDRDAMRNPGLFASEENYYYKRILNLVKDKIMPRIISVSAKLIKDPNNAIYWGPYLLKTTNNVKELCKQFELVCTNGRLTFQDVQFLVITDELQQLFDLAQMGSEIKWKDMLEKLGDFDKNIAMDALVEDFKDLGGLLASIGGSTVDSNLQEMSRIGKIFHSKPKEIYNLYKDFKDKYKTYSSAGNVGNILMNVIQTADADGVARLFKIDDYNITGYISNYLKEFQGEYYTQRWYISQVEEGSRVLCDYTPYSYGSDYDNYAWLSEWNRYESAKDKLVCHKLTASEMKELKDKAYRQCGWNEEKVAEYNKNNPNHTCTITYSLNHKDFTRTYHTGAFGTSKHRRRVCLYSYSVYVVDRWHSESPVYEQIFDSQTMNLATFKKALEIKLKGYQDQLPEEGSDIKYQIFSDPPRYYTMADEKKMEGCNSVSFNATCDGGEQLAKGSFNWKENGKQGDHLDDRSKRFAFDPTPESENNNIDEIIEKQEICAKEVADLTEKVTINDKKLKELIAQKKQATLAGNKDKVKEIEEEYRELFSKTEKLKEELELKQEELNELDDSIDTYYSDLGDNMDGDYRIGENMDEMESMYELRWTDQGEWVEGYSQFIFVRHAYCPSIKSNVTYSATLTISQKPKYFLGIRIHRAIMSVDFCLESEYGSDNVVAVLKLDMSKSEQERADEVNNKLIELMAEMPGCSFRIKYNYASKAEDDSDEDPIHLLWASDRLDVAREVDLQLVTIYSRLVLLDKVLQDRETILGFLKNKILDVVSRDARSVLANYALSRWESAGAKAAAKASLKTDGENKE